MRRTGAVSRTGGGLDHFFQPRHLPNYGLLCVQYSSGRTRGAEIVGFCGVGPPTGTSRHEQHNPPREAGRRRRWLEFTGRAVDSRPAHSHAPTYTVVTQPTLFAMMHPRSGRIMHQPTQQCGGTSANEPSGYKRTHFTVPCYSLHSPRPPAPRKRKQAVRG